MKFQHLSIGTRFVYETHTYTKISPLLASADGGEQRMIPRYAKLLPVDGAPVVSTSIAVDKLIALVDVQTALQALQRGLYQHLEAGAPIDKAALDDAIAQFNLAVL
ncbi:MAG: hypothetical protein HOP20_09450 [Sulfuriferula sp.]|nr:hypothetical protein [Sulfuriferula sp.]